MVHPNQRLSYKHRVLRKRIRPVISRTLLRLAMEWINRSEEDNPSSDLPSCHTLS
jgi:hypothetical protein